MLAEQLFRLSRAWPDVPFTRLTATLRKPTLAMSGGPGCGSTSPKPTKKRVDMDRQTHWNTIYSDRQPEEVSWFQRTPAVSLEVIASTGLPAGSRIIDIGGGASRLVDQLLDQGFTDITVLDVSEVALAHGQRRVGQDDSRIRWLLGDLLDTSLGGPFDLWHDRAVFHFLTDLDDRERYAAQLTAALAPGGHAVIATFAEDGPTQCSGLPVVRYAPEQLQSELGDTVRLVESRRENHMTPDGREQRFLYCLFQRSASG